MYIDVGTNRGVQIRKLFWPKLYPKARVRRYFDDAFGSPSERCRVCAVAIEPNPRHKPRLETLRRQLAAAGARVAVLHGAASNADGATTFAAANLTRGDKQHDWSASASAWMQQRFKLQQRTLVRTLDLGRVIERIDLNLRRSAPERQRASNIWMKLDVEGAELHIVPHLLLSRAMCAVSFIDIEWHTKFLRQVLSRQGGGQVALAASNAVFRLVATALPGARNNFTVAAAPGCRTRVVETYDESYSWDPVKNWAATAVEGCARPR